MLSTFHNYDISDSTTFHSFHPPELLNIEEDFIDISANYTLEINCVGNYPLAWKTPQDTVRVH